ncbi:MAG: SIS domain-containing protein [Chlorobi bacterium]|nr:MAG: SIS domain-containing protein [Bacteroidota bacterium]KXK34227.1 MAG: phosphoheptose isomerase [Chlorobi bacterium OLB6]MBE2266305.1 SIS domain-containing protein [Flavobacteriales bacterium]MBL1161055.1 SIS domain-containing protein [Chlorobiota bacterium]MBW7854288.1 SIS domain-containing protein [Candidatus Kapabacteria bacterium]MCC6330999.1 SIS domain-containing protein [Ignavibacteria bacterium]
MSSPFTLSRIASTITESISTKQELLQTQSQNILDCGELLASAAVSNALIMLCGNGGSAADSQHIAAELVVRLRGSVERRAIKAMALTVDSSVLTAGGNDYGYNRVFERQVEAFASPGSVLVAISTSGTSANVVQAVTRANMLGVQTVGLLGGSGGVLNGLCTKSVVVPSTNTARIQECHIMIGHLWCEMIEEAVAPELFR